MVNYPSELLADERPSCSRRTGARGGPSKPDAGHLLHCETIALRLHANVSRAYRDGRRLDNLSEIILKNLRPDMLDALADTAEGRRDQPMVRLNNPIPVL